MTFGFQKMNTHCALGFKKFDMEPSMKFYMAPEQGDIIWKNFDSSPQLSRVTRVSTVLAMITLLILFGVPVALFSFLLNFEGLKKYFLPFKLMVEASPFLAEMFRGFLAVAGEKICMALLPLAIKGDYVVSSWCFNL